MQFNGAGQGFGQFGAVDAGLGGQPQSTGRGSRGSQSGNARSVMLLGTVPGRSGGRRDGGQAGAAKRPFDIEFGPGANGGRGSEGIQYKNLLGTYMTGPLLVRNPPLLRYFADRLSTGVPDPCALFTYLDKAYHLALGELMARIGG